MKALDDNYDRNLEEGLSMLEAFKRRMRDEDRKPTADEVYGILSCPDWIRWHNFVCII